jgi:hypothetical protein
VTNPNIVNVTSIYGKISGLAIPITATTIVTNAASSGTVVKVNALYVGNVDTAVSYKVTVAVLKGGATSYRMLYQISIPAGAGLDVLSKSIYLEENDSLQLTADLVSKLEAVCSYEIIAGPPT